jgi:hypothetical protein
MSNGYPTLPPIVLAGNYAQFRHWCTRRNENPKRALFIGSLRDVHKLRGRFYIREDIHVVGSFIDLEDAGAVWRMVVDTCRGDLPPRLYPTSQQYEADHTWEDSAGYGALLSELIDVEEVRKKNMIH